MVLLPTTNEWKMSKLEAFTEVLTYVTCFLVMWHKSIPKADKKLVQANSKVTELEAKLAELQQELTVLWLQDKRTPIVWDDKYRFSGSDSEPTSSRSSRKRKKGQAFPLTISYRDDFFLSESSTSVLADEPMLRMLASLSQAVGSQTTLPLVNPLTSRIAPPWGKGDLWQLLH